MKMTLMLLLLSFITHACMKNSDAFGDQEISNISSPEYRIGLFQSTEIDFQKITHLIIVGSALKDDSDQFFQSGVARAQRYKELWPTHQIVFISSPEVKDHNDETVFAKYNINVVKIVSDKLTPDHLFEEMNPFNFIASFDFYGHASPWAMILGKTGAAFDPSAHSEELKLLRSHFTPDAYATLNACNTGFYLAPDLSKALQIPASGSLTSSMFERIEKDGYWYKEEDQRWWRSVSVNRKSFMSSQSCALGFCTRMKSSRKNYSSYWGTFTKGGLGFDKFFCNYDQGESNHCERAMALSLLSFPSLHPLKLNSSDEEIATNIYDWLCSTGRSKNYFLTCKQGLEKSISSGSFVYQSHSENELNCDFHSCHTQVICKKDSIGPIAGTCDLDALPNNFPTNTAREFLSYKKGFENLKVNLPQD